MQILVVDDEALVRESVVNSLKSFGIDDILVAQDGFDALKLLNVSKPDIVITDIRMPEMDGIEFLSKSREIHPDLIFILLSGYELFEYAHKAIQYGAFSYLLKPVSDEELKSVIENAIETISRKNKQREFNSLMRIGGTQGADFLKTRLISELVKGDFVNTEYSETKLKELHINFDKEFFQIFLVSIDYFKTLEGVSSKEYELSKFSINNITSEILANNNISMYPFDYETGMGFLLNISSDSVFNDKMILLPLLGEILENVNLFLDFSVTIGVGMIVSSIFDLSNSYIHAQESVLQRLARGGNQVFFHDKATVSKDTTIKIGFKTEESFKACFEKCDKLGAINIIKNLYEPFESVEIIDIGNLHKLNFQLILLIYKIVNALGLNSEELLGDEFVLYNSLNAQYSFKAIIKYFDELLEICLASIILLNEKGNMKIMEITKEFIAKNYNKDITLKTISGNVHLSTAYFSKQFKLYFGENFSDYIINYRINNAKEFLKAGIYKATEVSKIVGFNDEKYFYKVFKRHTGFTPTEYKDIYRNSK